MSAPGERPHVTVIHRWRDRYADYARYLDHERYAVSYLTTGVGLPAVPAGAVETVTVPATNDLERVRREVDRLAGRYGPQSGIVALKEDDLLVAARLRAERGLPGPRPERLLPFLDKLPMVREVAEHGLSVPEFAPADSSWEVAAFAEKYGWPVIVKPRIGSASEGVELLRGPEDLDAAALDPGTPRLVQVFDPNPVYHVDGVYDGRELAACVASRYLRTCLEFRHGEHLGSVEEDDPEVNAAVADFARRVLRALSAGPVAFHLEVFVERPEQGPPQCTFLEIGARVGGAEIPFLWREVHGYDLMEAAFRISLGEPPPPPGPLDAGRPEGGLGGWLLVGAPAARPCRVTEATPMTGRVPGPYAEALLRPGEVIPAADAFYEHVGGRFRFRGRSSAEVEAAVVATAAAFRVTAESI